MSYKVQIGVYAIMRNEIENVREWAACVAGANFVTVLDTGSTDGTRAALRDALEDVRDPETFHIETAWVKPFRFDVAHNTALALTPEWLDICVPLAADERLSPGWLTAIREAVPYNSYLKSEHTHRPENIGSTKFTYRYEFAPGMSFTHDRIHSREGYHWRYPFHEGIYPTFADQEMRVHVPGLTISQRQDKQVKRLDRDNFLAEIAVREFPNDPRMTFYAGRQFMYAGDLDRALNTLHRYFGLARAANLNHPVEAQWCAEAIAECYRRKAGK